MLIVAAAAVLLVKEWLPFGRYLLYPFTLLTTWVHEMGHGLTAIAVGGSFERLVVFADAGGYAQSRFAPGWPQALVSVGGLLAPPLVGALLLAIVRGPRRARVALLGLAIALAGSAVIWVRSPVGLVTVGGFAVLFALAGVKGGPSLRMWLVQIVAVVCALDTLTRMVEYAFMKTITSGAMSGARSDVANAAEALGVPHLLVALGVVAAALALLALGVWAGLRQPAAERPR